MTTRGKLIVLEGINGSGTTTQAEQLGTFLHHEYGETIVEREPWSGGLEDHIRAHIGFGTTALDMAVLFTADRLLHVDCVIEPALAEGIHVVCDRYRMSTMVYQGLGLPTHDRRFIRRLTLLPSLPKPDLTLLLDIDSTQAYARLGKTQEPVLVDADRYEKDRQFQAFVRKAYLDEMAHTENCFKIDASKDEPVVAEEIRDSLWRLRL